MQAVSQLGALLGLPTGSTYPYGNMGVLCTAQLGAQGPSAMDFGGLRQVALQWLALDLTAFHRRVLQTTTGRGVWSQMLAHIGFVGVEV